MQSDEQFLSHIDKALEKFGTTVKAVVYFRFYEEHKMKREQIADRPDLFVATIDKFFGVGSDVVKSSIEMEMRAAASPVELGQSSTVDILRRARNHFQQA
ncbi:MAG: hypothetical protein JRN15_05160 [Nitrososphaerota archaeon]|nr:hypothetical protein [Nitrososphaerota archaeon]